MYRLFKISNFRCFRDLTLSKLERVNLVTGVNNVGKTALLEAIFLHCGAHNPALALKINAFRGIEAVKGELGRWTETPWDSLFCDFDTSRSIELVGEGLPAGRRVLRLRPVRDPAELAKTGLALPHGSGRPESPILSSETAQVLELECEEGDQRRKYHMILDTREARAEPIPPPPPCPAFFLAARFRVPLAEDAERFGKLEVIGQQDVLLKALQVIEPRLRRLAAVVAGGVPMLHGDIGLTRLVPLCVMGEGMVRVASLVLAIGNARDGVVLVDEIENGLHYAMLPKLWRAVAEVAGQFNTQVIATTHSRECIVAAYSAFKAENRPTEFRLHRLDPAKDAIRAVTYDQDALGAAIDTGLEVR